MTAAIAKSVLLRALVVLAFVAVVPILGIGQQQVSSSGLALVGGKVYVSPQADPVQDAVILLHDGKIEAVGARTKVKIPPNYQRIDCSGKVVIAGFWNSHVHFTEDVWTNAATAPAGKLEQHMQEMLTRWGFTTVFDIASSPRDTLPLRRRVESGELPGPRIYTTAGAIFPENGIPFYVTKEVAAQLKPFEAATPADAARLAKDSLSMGGDGIKLFTGALELHAKVISMPVEVVRAAVEVAHAAGKPVFAHPSNHVGTDNALSGGVDVLAHTIPIEQSWTPEELAQMKAQHTGLTPTLTLWEVEMDKEPGSEEDKQAFVQRGVNQLKSYFDQGGTVLFGTDVGYTQHYDTTEEYVLMAKSGMTWRDILASLTSNPAGFFKHSHTGELTAGNDADLVVLSADPASDVRSFAKVDYTIRSGKVIFKR